MPRDGDGTQLRNALSGILLSHLFVVTNSARSPSLWRVLSVLFGVFMPSLAMRPRSLVCYSVDYRATRETSNLIMTGRLQNAFKSQSFRCSLNDSIRLHAGLFCKVSYDMFSAIYYNPQKAASTITRLLFSGRPAAVIRRVVGVIINAFQRVASGTRPHVGNKLLERLLPSKANRYSPSTIVRIGRAGFAVAPTQHALPNGVKRVWAFKWHSIFYAMYAK